MKLQMKIDNFFDWLNTPSETKMDTVIKTTVVFGILGALVLAGAGIE